MAKLKYFERSFFSCLVVHHKSHIYWTSGSETGSWIYEYPMLDQTLSECWIFPPSFKCRNGCPSLFCHRPPPFHHPHVVCHSPICNHLSFPNGSILSLRHINLYIIISYQDRSPSNGQRMGITDTSFAKEHAASKWVTSSPEGGGSMFLQNVCI